MDRTGSAGPVTPAPPAVIAAGVRARVVAVKPDHAPMVRVKRGGTASLHPAAVQSLARDSLNALVERAQAEIADACRQCGGPAIRPHVLAQAAKRTGLVQTEVARRQQIRRDGAAAAPVNRSRPADGLIARLAVMILSERECDVFLARRHAQPDDIAGLQDLASRLRISVDRIYQLEASARRKLMQSLG